MEFHNWGRDRDCTYEFIMVEEIAVLTNDSSSARAERFFTSNGLCNRQKGLSQQPHGRDQQGAACQENKTCPEPLCPGEAKT